jgi:ribosomal protein S18 acetylase RimI-like enzyme
MPELFTNCRTTWMSREAAAACARIERASYKPEACEGPAYFRGTATSERLFCRVALLEGSEVPVGYVVWMNMQPRFESLTVMDLAVDPAFRRQGIGRLLLRDAMARVEEYHMRGLTVVSVDSELSAHLFLRACGLRCDKVEEIGEDEERQDAYVFVWRPVGVSVRVAM